ncbi:MAG: DnaD domain protein [Clostridia bacterium]|nr:DnaD domain protein [Clostridia bacterium]
MEYNLNLGVWKSVFAVPGEIVDKHIKLAGAAQLKVILWVLRHAGENFTTEDIAKALSMQLADVRDCMQYWEQMGIISVDGGNIMPKQTEDIQPVEIPQEKQEVPVAETKTETVETPKDEPIPQKPPETPKRVMSRPEKPDMKYLAQRMEEDSSIAYLMQSADEIFGRMTSNNDKATLLLIHEYDGLPVEVIIMLLQYASGIGKANMRYIEKMAISWADDEITSLDLAEKKIKQLTSSREAARIVQRTLGTDEHSPTEREITLADRWLNIWKFTPEMVRKAYETCVDAKGKYIPNYVNRILDRWHSSGITTVEQADEEQNAKQSKSKPKEKYQATYDIAEFESEKGDEEEW